MNNHFIKGFLKVAEKELWRESATGEDWDRPTAHRQERQKIVEQYEGNGNALKKKTHAVAHEADTKNPSEYLHSGSIG